MWGAVANSWCHASMSERAPGLKLSWRWKNGNCCLAWRSRAPVICHWSCPLTLYKILSFLYGCLSFIVCLSDVLSCHPVGFWPLKPVWKGVGKKPWLAQSVPFIPVSLFCCMMVLFLRSRRTWEDMTWLRSDVLLDNPHPENYTHGIIGDDSDSVWFWFGSLLLTC